MDKVTPPIPPANLTPESVAEYKKAMRAYDAARITNGVAPEVIQQENSFIPPTEKMRLTGRQTVPESVKRLTQEK